MKQEKSIRILTFHSALSFGAVLQSFALTKFLEERFSDVKIINFCPETFSVKPKWSAPLTWIKWFQFRFARKLPLTRSINANELRTTPPEADVYIIGSDQVWNPAITKEYQDIYCGDFIPKNKIKISYASSFGRAELDESEKGKLAQLFHDFTAISVREQSGVELCRDITGKDATCVMDPTFLIEDYSKYFNLGRIRNELCLFVLDNDSDDCFKTAFAISEALNLSPKVLNKNRPVTGFKNIAFPSVPRFVKEIYSSRFVLTNSFHGLAFAIIFRKNFAFVCTNKNNATRPINLLSKLGLMDRYFHSYEELLHSNTVFTNVSFDENKIQSLRKSSIEYLISNIK